MEISEKSRKLEKVDKIYHLIYSGILLIVILFPKIVGVKFTTIFQFIPYLYDNKTALNVPPTIVLVLSLLIIVISLLVMLSIFKKWKKLGDNLHLESTGIFVNAVLLAFLGIVTPSDKMEMVFGYSFWAYLVLCVGGVISLIIIFSFATSEQYASTKKKPCQILDGEKIIYQVDGFDGFGPPGKLIITPERIIIFKRDSWTGNLLSHSIRYEKILYFKKPGKIFANRIKINYTGEHGKVKKVTFIPWLDDSIKRNRQEVRDIIEYINKKVKQEDVSEEIWAISKSKKKKTFR